ncbi:uncharacterized protein LOC111283557 [Durio zibethinus]|uniref:Uncharacterized protein LOC111283557 n=1 Tax=Durio zibethinus TaxID=66656 RepID=A0A6P5XJ90_DURZI|nr:uncharacterized protein LOC111283557 [Durio zibethinus]
MGHGIEAVLISPEENYYPCTTRLDFNCTNNVTEYETCEWEIRDPKLVLYQRHITEQALKNDKRIIQRLAAGFMLDGKILYKKSRDQILLRCVDVVKARKTLEEVHEKIYETHANGHMMVKQIMRAGYYWSIIENDCIKATPLSLVYKMEVILPIEVEISSLRVLIEAKLDEVEWVQDRFDMTIEENGRPIEKVKLEESLSKNERVAPNK